MDKTHYKRKNIAKYQNKFNINIFHKVLYDKIR